MRADRRTGHDGRGKPLHPRFHTVAHTGQFVGERAFPTASLRDKTPRFTG